MTDTYRPDFNGEFGAPRQPSSAAVEFQRWVQNSEIRNAEKRDSKAPTEFGTPDYRTRSGVPGIVVGRGPKPGDEWDSYGSDRPPEKATKSAGDEWESYGANEPPKPKERKEISGTQAFSTGLTNLFGAGPAIAGLAEASGIEEPNLYEDVSPPEGAKRAGLYVARPFVGAVKLAHDWITNSGDPATVEAYNRGRQGNLDFNDEAYKQHAPAYIMGQLSQGLGIPLSGVAKGAGALTRGLGALRAGVTGGALSGAGGAISEGKDVGDIAIDTGAGGVLGGGLGVLGQGLVEGVGSGVGGLAKFVRQRNSPESAAGRKMEEAFTADRANPRTPEITPEITAAGRVMGTPIAAADVGGPAVQELADWAATHSPEAAQALSEFAQQRFWNQGSRMSTLMRSAMGRPVDMQALKDAAHGAIAPLYKRAHALGNYHMDTPELQALVDTPDIAEVMGKAAKNLKSWAKADGVSPPPSGMQNLQFWDYVHRELSKKIQKNLGNSTGTRLQTIDKQLKEELDRLVPEFKDARQDFAMFKRGERAYETGQDWVLGNPPSREARQFYAKLTAPERELLAHGFAESFITKVERTGDSNDLLNKINGNENARQLFRMALGPRASEVEAGLRLEEIVDRLRGAGAGSQTGRRMATGERESVGGALSGIEAMKEAGMGAVGILSATVGLKAAQREVGEVDKRVATELSRMLLSGDPDKFAGAVRRISASRVMMDGVRRMTESGVRTTIGVAGPRGVAAGVAPFVPGISHNKEHHHPNADQEFPGASEVIPR